MYRVSVVSSPRSWEESVMGVVKSMADDSPVYEGTIKEVHAWLNKKGLVCLNIGYGIWTHPIKPSLLVRLVQFIKTLPNMVKFKRQVRT